MKIKLKENHFYILGAVSLLIASIFSVGYHHFDEHFQILEFGSLKLGLTTVSNLPWEFHDQMRPAFQPAIVVISHYLWGMIGIDNPFFITFFLRLLTAALSFISIWFLYKTYKNRINSAVLQHWFLILSFLLWFVIYNGVRFSSENWSGSLFAIGFSCYFLFKKRNFVSFFIIGAILGLSFLCRYQIAFLILGFGLWLVFIRKERFINLLFISFGILSLFLIGILIDRWFYGEWTLSTWNYFNENIVNDKISGFGAKPWWWYITTSLQNGIPPFSLLFVGGFLIITFFRLKSPIVWSLVPFIFIHSIIGHKELRFLFPIILFMPIVMIQGIETIQNRYYHRLSENKYLKSFMMLFFIINFAVLLIVSFNPADSQIYLYKKLYKEYKEPTTLFYINKNPYRRVLDIHYYKRKNLTIKHINSIDSIPLEKKGLVVLTNRNKSNNLRLGNLIYSTYPNWILKFNVNNWIDRTNVWYIYELKTELMDKTVL